MLFRNAEAIEVIFDPEVISYEELAKFFLEIHNPEEKDRQGPDIGSQYRSSIFYLSQAQEKAARKLVAELVKKGYRVQTEIRPASLFYPAEEYHKEYYDSHRSAPYCMVIIDPKIRKLMENFKENVKEEYK